MLVLRGARRAGGLRQQFAKDVGLGKALGADAQGVGLRGLRPRECCNKHPKCHPPQRGFCMNLPIATEPGQNFRPFGGPVCARHLYIIAAA
ncbi:hypothetical protein D9M72_560810 [compost metagenome]